MDSRQALLLALQVSVISTVFGFGLKTTFADFSYLFRRPALLARSVIAVFVIMPLVAVALFLIFDFPRTVEIVLIALSVSPVPPLLAKRDAANPTPYTLGLTAILALLAIVTVPVSLELLGRFATRPLGVAPGAVIGLLAKTVLIPLAAGLALRAMLPAIADRIEKTVTRAAAVLVAVAVVVLLAAAATAIWALVVPSTIIAMVVFSVVGLGVGHVLGGPDRATSTVLALSAASRHPAIAFTIAAANFPEERFGALILLYVLVNALVGVPYLRWQRRRAGAADGAKGTSGSATPSAQ